MVDREKLGGNGISKNGYKKGKVKRSKDKGRQGNLFFRY